MTSSYTSRRLINLVSWLSGGKHSSLDLGRLKDLIGYRKGWGYQLPVGFLSGTPLAITDCSVPCPPPQSLLFLKKTTKLTAAKRTDKKVNLLLFPNSTRPMKESQLTSQESNQIHFFYISILIVKEWIHKSLVLLSIPSRWENLQLSQVASQCCFACPSA